jgi:hypothetical protein
MPDSCTILQEIFGRKGFVTLLFQRAVDGYGAVVERYDMDPFGGNLRVYDAAWNLKSPAGNISFSGGPADTVLGQATTGTEIGWSYFGQALRYDRLTGIYTLGTADYNPTTAQRVEPNVAAIGAGASAYDATGGETGLTGFYHRNIQSVYNVGAGLVATGVGIVTSPFITPAGGFLAATATFAVLGGTWRYAAEGQSATASTLGGVGDATGFGGLWTGWTGQDFGTFQDLGLSANQRSLAGLLGGIQLLSLGWGLKGSQSSKAAAELNLQKNVRAGAWADMFGKPGPGLGQLVSDVERGDPMRIMFAKMIRQIRASGGAVRAEDMGTRVVASFGGESLKSGIWFRYNPSKLRVIDMLEEAIHWQQIQRGLSTRGYTVTALEVLAKRSLLDQFGQSLGPALRFELLDDIARLKAGTYLTMG